MNSLTNQNKLFNILLIGQQKVGKSSLVLKYTKNTFSSDYIITKGREYYTKIVKNNERDEIKLQIWDTMGQQKYRSIVRSLYHGSCAILLVFAINDYKSFILLQNWYNQIQHSANKQTIYWLVGTKLDLEEERSVQKKQISEFGNKIKAVGMMEVSSKTGQNVKEFFQKLAKYLWKKYQNSADFRQFIDQKLSSVELNSKISSDDVRQSKKCCEK